MQSRYQLVYLSRILENVGASSVTDIVRAARSNNTRLHINSVLIFDGWRFCQYLEGEEAIVAELVDRIRTDARHTDFRLLYHATCSGIPLIPDQSLAFALSNETSLEYLADMASAEVIDALHKLLPTLDY